jgi:guanylate kinase
VISYTTRPPREGEIDGVDYHYISEDEFKQKLKDNFFAEHTIYRDWYYGTSKEDCTEDKVLVANPHGLRQIKAKGDIVVTAFYVKTSGRERLIRMLNRGDDIMECFRRYFSDSGTFQNIEEEVDIVLDGELHTSYLVGKILANI